MGHRHGLILLLFACVLASCKRPPATHVGDAGPVSSTDHLARGEVAEGKELAFGLRLPHTSKVYARFPKALHVSCDSSPEELANYVRARVTEGAITPGATMTRFDDVKVKAEPSRHLSVEIRPAPMGSPYRSAMIVKDVTPPEPSNESLDEQLKKAGVTREGKLVDPKNMQ